MLLVLLSLFFNWSDRPDPNPETPPEPEKILEITPVAAQKLPEQEGDDHSRAGRKPFKNKGLRTIAASETFFPSRAKKPVKFHRRVFGPNFRSQIGDIGAQDKMSVLLRLAT